MPYEIELKAWVEDPYSLKATIDRLCVYAGEYTKDDTYWNSPKMSLRIRREQWADRSGIARDATLVTYKTKELRDATEVNAEQEFTVSHRGVFEDLLSMLNFTPGISKRKTGWSWNYPGGQDAESSAPGQPQAITVELSLVDSLGWFVELEIIAQDRDEDTIQNAQKRLHQLLGCLGIEADRIESRFYSELLGLQEK